MRADLIGRDHPAGALRAEIGRATASHGGLVLVTGEAGIGKTTLVTGAGDEARRLGALVLSGSCWDSDSAPGYWPWTQVIRALRHGGTPEEWAAAHAASGSALAALLGEAPHGEASHGEETEAFRLYDAVTAALVAVSHSRPVVVVLDDLHWADTASLKLLEFAAQHTWFERLLLIGTYRDVEVEAADGHPLRSLMVPLVAKATSVTLTGLAPDEVGALMARTVGERPDSDLAAEVHRRTGGNPFFVEQTARLWHSGGLLTSVAPGVRDALRRRLSLLPAPVAELLRAAAVLGQEFHRQVLAAAVAAPVPQVDRLIDHAVTARLVVSRGSGRFAFIHDLVRETLYGELDEAEARRRHAAVVRALDRSVALAERVPSGDLARHGYLAGDELDVTRAVDLLEAAAKDASLRLAFEEAAGHLRRALERVGERDPRRWVRLALDLAHNVHHSGDWDEGWRIYTRAVDRARELGDAELLARVALTVYSTGGGSGHEKLKSELLREAHGLLVGGDAARDEGVSTEQLARQLTVSFAVRARREKDDEALGFGLLTRHNTIWGPGTAGERLALTDELIAVARRSEDTELEHFASSLRWVALLEQGDPRFLDQYHAFTDMAQQRALPRYELFSAVDQSIITALMGRFDESERLLREVARHSVDHGEHPDFGFLQEHLRWALLQLQGRFEELDALHPSLRRGGHPYHELLEAITAVQRGDTEDALRYLSARIASGETYPRIYEPMWLRFQAQAAAASGDPELCERARSAIAPYAAEWAVSLFGCDISGPMSLWLALLDAAQERWDEAVNGFVAARESADRLQARTWSLEARSHLARALLGRGAARDAEAAGALLDEVEREAAEVGMWHVVERVKHTRSGPAEPRSAASAQEFRRDGAVWSLSFDGRTVHLPDAKGLRDLHHLLSRPGTEIPAVQLVSPEGGDVVVAARRMGGDAILDEEAKAQYKRRLTRLDEEIDRAAELGDDRRAAEYDRERQALLDELRAAAGLAGRGRRLGDEAERARKTVTARIRDTLRKLDTRHPALAAHLRATVTTGSTCCYQPARDPAHSRGRDIAWRL